MRKTIVRNSPLVNVEQGRRPPVKITVTVSF
jgi:hypothetical protein